MLKLLDNKNKPSTNKSTNKSTTEIHKTINKNKINKKKTTNKINKINHNQKLKKLHKKFNNKHNNKHKNKHKLKKWYKPIIQTNITTLIPNINSNQHKEYIPKRIRELVWTTHNGETFAHKCFVTWCNNNINVFNFQVGHDIPESKGGTIDIDNLKPICGNCNLSMGNKYSITEWCKLVKIY